MDSKKYSSFVKYLKHGTFPSQFPSTKPNFVREAKKYRVNRKGVLLKGNLIVVKQNERKNLFDKLHEHSGIFSL